MWKRSRFVASLVAFVAVAGAVIGFSACSDDPSEEEATAALCSDLAELGTTLAAYNSLTADSTIDDVEEAQDEVQDAMDAVVASAEDVADARVDELEAAWDDLLDATDEISGEDTVGEAAVTLVQQAEAVESARADLFSASGCS